jgi:hypothetical protein
MMHGLKSIKMFFKVSGFAAKHVSLSMLLITCTPTTKYMQFGICLLQHGSDPLSSLHIFELEYKIYNFMWLQNVAIKCDESLGVSKKTFVVEKAV